MCDREAGSMLMVECGWQVYGCSLNNPFNLAAGLETFIIKRGGGAITLNSDPFLI